MDSIFAYISALAGIIGIVAGLEKFYHWLKSTRSSSKILKVFERNRNIYGQLKDGSEIQLTHSNADQSPILLKRKAKVVFLRSEVYRQEKEYTRYKLLSVDVTSLDERVLADQKPFWDGLDMSFEILQPRSLTISRDQSKILFLVEKYATASEMVQIDVNTGKFEELFSAEKFDLIKSGKYKDKFLVGVSEIRDRGRDIYYHIYDKNGKSLKRFEDYTDYMEFRSGALVGKQ